MTRKFVNTAKICVMHIELFEIFLGLVCCLSSFHFSSDWSSTPSCYLGCLIEENSRVDNFQRWWYLTGTRVRIFLKLKISHAKNMSLLYKYRMSDTLDENHHFFLLKLFSSTNFRLLSNASKWWKPANAESTGFWSFLRETTRYRSFDSRYIPKY